MFLCDDCHNPENHFAYFRSFGRCESCDKKAPCVDCHDADCHPKEKPAKKDK